MNHAHARVFLCGPTREVCTDVTATVGPHFIDGTTTDWGVGGNTTGFSTTGGGHNGSNTAGTASGADYNCFVEYHFFGTFAAGKPYKLSVWIEAVNFSNTVPYAFGVGAATGVAGPPGTPSDGVTGSIALTSGVEQLLEIEWTPSANRTGVTVRWGGLTGDTGLLILSDGSIKSCELVDRLNGTSNLAARCDHLHHWFSTDPPTVNDDVTLGYRVGTIWHQVDDLDAPTEILAEWVLVDASDGAAVWLEWPLPSLSLSNATPLVESGSGTPGTATDASRSDHVHPADAGGGGAAGHTHTWNETPSGTINSSNDTFTLVDVPASDSLLLFLDGVLQEASQEYTRSGNTITFSTAPTTGSRLLASYIGGGGTTYNGVVLGDSPVHYWRLNEASGSLVDSIGANNGAVTGSLTYGASGATGDGDDAISNAAGGYATIGYGDIPVGTAAWSVEFLYKGTDAGKQCVISWGSQSTRASVYVNINQGASPRLGIASWSDDQTVTATGLLDGNYHHVVFTKAASASTVKVYMDGSLLGTLTFGGALSGGTGDTPIIMGDHHSPTSDRLNGTLDELAIYDVELTSTQVSGHNAAIGNT